MARIIIVEDPPEANKELQEYRQKICDGCDNYTKEFDSCSLCSCTIARKKFYIDSDCPDGKW